MKRCWSGSFLREENKLLNLSKLFASKSFWKVCHARLWRSTMILWKVGWTIGDETWISDCRSGAKIVFFWWLFPHFYFWYFVDKCKNFLSALINQMVWVKYKVNITAEEVLFSNPLMPTLSPNVNVRVKSNHIKLIMRTMPDPITKISSVKFL